MNADAARELWLWLQMTRAEKEAAATHSIEKLWQEYCEFERPHSQYSITVTPAEPWCLSYRLNAEWMRM